MNDTTSKLCVHTIMVDSPEGMVAVTMRDGRVMLDYHEISVFGEPHWPDETSTLAGLLGCTEPEARALVGMLTDM